MSRPRVELERSGDRLPLWPCVAMVCGLGATVYAMGFVFALWWMGAV